MQQLYVVNWATLQLCKLTIGPHSALAVASSGWTELHVLDLKQTSFSAEVEVLEYIIVLILKMQELPALVSQRGVQLYIL